MNIRFGYMAANLGFRLACGVTSGEYIYLFLLAIAGTLWNRTWSGNGMGMVIGMVGCDILVQVDRTGLYRYLS